MSTKPAAAHNQHAGFQFEFAVADCGLGFLRELKRAGMHGIETDQAAIEWCIQKGNSTKKRTVDEWAQRLPADMMGNPMVGIGQVVESDNHHMGLGLAKLIQEVERFRGSLWLASGDTMLCIWPNGTRRYGTILIPWQGVALACRFDSVPAAYAEAEPSADEFESILGELLRGA